MGRKSTVYKGDFGEVLQHVSGLHNAMFAVLNMANQYQPGGGYADGCPAQEEHMWFRGDSHLLQALETKQDPWRVPVAQYDVPLGERASFHPAPRVLFKGKEVWLANGDINREASFAKIHPIEFWELRSCAVDTRRFHSVDRERYSKSMARRIANQFRVLRQNGVRCVLLSAFGCGAFMNASMRSWGSAEVAKLYRAAAAANASHFDRIDFAIYHPGYGANNYTIWESALAQG
jgi:hypothetical protein